jgi:hypothetical protein
MSDRVHGEGSCATLCGRDRGTRSSVTSLVRLDRFGGADQAARDARPRDEELEPQAIAARGADPRVGATWLHELQPRDGVGTPARMTAERGRVPVMHSAFAVSGWA